MSAEHAYLHSAMKFSIRRLYARASREERMARGEREKESKREEKGGGGKKKSTRRKRLLMSDPRNLAASRKRRKRGRSLARAEGGGQICKPD